MTRSTASRTFRRSRPLLAALGVLLLSAAPSSAADGDASVSYVESTDEGLQVLVSVPANVEVDLDGVTMTVDGADAAAEAALATSTTSVRRTTILTIDTSNSMRGDRFAAAKTAAETFLDTVPDDVYVGIVTFDSTVDEALPPSLDRDEAQSVIDGLELDAQTSLYDGVLAAVEMAGTEGQRSLLVLSDGADTTDTRLEDVTAAVTDAETLVDVVALEQTGDAKQALEELATSGGGEVIDADPEALRDAFDERADVLARQVLVTGAGPRVGHRRGGLDLGLPARRRHHAHRLRVRADPEVGCIRGRRGDRPERPRGRQQHHDPGDLDVRRTGRCLPRPVAGAPPARAQEAGADVGGRDGRDLHRPPGRPLRRGGNPQGRARAARPGQGRRGGGAPAQQVDGGRDRCPAGGSRQRARSPRSGCWCTRRSSSEPAWSACCWAAAASCSASSSSRSGWSRPGCTWASSGNGCGRPSTPPCPTRSS